ncbi:MAG: mechanosensitive ion channel family protein [Gemmataceae bacterium]
MEPYEALWQNFVEFSPRLLAALGLFLAFWLAGLVSHRIIEWLTGLSSAHAELTRFLGRSLRITLLIVGAITALGTVGVDVSALVAGLGLTGFAVGFALKDIISNAVSGILVIVYKPFRKGDEITVAAFAGKVADVNLRYTVLDAEGKSVFIPNATLFTSPVVVTRSPAESRGS